MKNKKPNEVELNKKQKVNEKKRLDIYFHVLK